MIFVTGDTHGRFRRFSSSNFPVGKKLTKDDYVIICGDYGGVWDLQVSAEELYWYKWFNKKPWTTLFCDGNHENFDRLNDLPVVELNGALCGKVSDSIYHVKRGEIMEIAGKKILFYGGATSIDKSNRILGMSFWEEEVPNRMEYDNLINNCEKHNFKIDIIITHTMPTQSVEELTLRFGEYKNKITDPVTSDLTQLQHYVEYGVWFCGHFHVEMSFLNNINCLYETIKKV